MNDSIIRSSIKNPAEKGASIAERFERKLRCDLKFRVPLSIAIAMLYQVPSFANTSENMIVGGLSASKKAPCVIIEKSSDAQKNGWNNLLGILGGPAKAADLTREGESLSASIAALPSGATGGGLGGIAGSVGGLAGGLGGLAGSLGGVSGGLGGLTGGLGGLTGGLGGVVGTVTGQVGGIGDALGNLGNTIGGIGTIGGVGDLINAGNQVGTAVGGVVNAGTGLANTAGKIAGSVGGAVNAAEAISNGDIKGGLNAGRDALNQFRTNTVPPAAPGTQDSTAPFGNQEVMTASRPQGQINQQRRAASQPQVGNYNPYYQNGSPQQNNPGSGANNNQSNGFYVPNGR